MDTDKIILASGSPRFSMLLNNLGLHFQVELPLVAELEDHDDSPELMVLHNADLKANCVAKKFSDALIIAADTTVALENTIFNKPKDLAEAICYVETTFRQNAYRLYGCLLNA